MKTINYTPEQTAQIISDYQSGLSVEIIADNLGKTVRSIVAKLSREKVYIKKEYNLMIDIHLTYHLLRNYCLLT